MENLPSELVYKIMGYVPVVNKEDLLNCSLRPIDVEWGREFWRLSNLYRNMHVAMLHLKSRYGIFMQIMCYANSAEITFSTVDD